MNPADNALKLDPRCKLLLLVLANIIAFTYDSLWTEIMITGMLLLLQMLCGRARSALRWLIFFISLVSIQYFILPLMPGVLAVMMTILTVFARRILPCMIMGSLIIGTTPVRHLIITLRKWRFPQSIIIPLSVTLRYFPAIGEEYRHIRDAMKLKEIRGIRRKIEYTIVPILVSAIGTSDELSAAAITRGIENPCPKTSIVDLRFHVQDYVCLAAFTALALYTVFAG